jgi:hypothetical protein
MTRHAEPACAGRQAEFEPQRTPRTQGKTHLEKKEMSLAVFVQGFLCVLCALCGFIEKKLAPFRGGFRLKR